MIKKVITASAFLLAGTSAFAQTPEFKGVIGTTLKESKEYWPEPVKAPKGAPNVVWILLDDVGYGALREAEHTPPARDGVDDLVQRGVEVRLRAGHELHARDVSL